MQGSVSQYVAFRPRRTRDKLTCEFELAYQLPGIRRKPGTLRSALEQKAVFVDTGNLGMAADFDTKSRLSRK